MPNYTNAAVDLVDSQVDDWQNNDKTYTQGDKVEGYTMSQIENTLIGCNTWDKRQDNIK